MKRKALLAASLVVALVLGMSIVPAGAYFTDTTEANGGIEVTLVPDTDIHEWYKTGVKHVVISNSEKATTAVYVRAGVFTSATVDIGGTDWTGPNNDLGDWVGPTGNGWYYYGQILQPGDQTENELTVAITWPKVDADEKPITEGDNFNVIVMYEATPVLYDADGNPYADWTLAQNIKPAEPTEGGN